MGGACSHVTNKVSTLGEGFRPGLSNGGRVVLVVYYPEGEGLYALLGGGEAPQLLLQHRLREGRHNTHTLGTRRRYARVYGNSKRFCGLRGFFKC